MKKNAKIILTVCALCFVIGIIAGYSAYNYIFYGPIKTKEPVSISTVVSDTSDLTMIGHRGFSAIAPENSLEAFAEAGKAGFKGCEFDIHLTSDGQWAVMHDSNIKKMTGKSGTIEEMTLEEFKAIPFTNGANIEKYENVFIPTLEETLAVIGEYDMAPIIEIKTATDEHMEDVIALLEKYDMLESAWIISFEQAPLIKMRALNEKVKMSYLTHEVNEEAIVFCVENNMTGLDFDKKDAGETEVKMIEDAGLVPQVWTVDTLEDFSRFYDCGVRYFTGNCLTY